MKNYKLKVLLEWDDVVYRDIIVNDKHNLLDLHNGILKAFAFEGNQMASFHQLNENLESELEIPLVSFDAKGKSMEEFLVEDFNLKEDTQVLYVYDYLKEWKFFIELVEMEKPSEKASIKVADTFGKAPKEDEKASVGEDAESILMNAILGEELMLDEEEDDMLESDGMDNIDDYEEYL